MENLVKRIKQLMIINEDIDTKLKRRYAFFKEIVESFLYESEGAIDGLIESSDDEFEFADEIIDMTVDAIMQTEKDQWLGDEDHYVLQNFIKDNFASEIIEYYYDNKEMDEY